MTEVVVIRNDRLDTPAEALHAYGAQEALEPGALFSILREAGIVGMGGATFPTGVKAQSSAGEIDTLIANACECEPYITADHALLRTHPERVLRGLALLRDALLPKRTVLAIENNKGAAIPVLRKALTAFPEIELKILPTRYPQGSEKQLILSLTGRELPPGKLPKDVGCAVFNVSTCAAVSQAVYEGKPLTERIVTVTGSGVKHPRNLCVRIGTPFSAVIEAAGGLTERAEKVISGGPMMGVAQADLSVPVSKGTNCILCLTAGREAPDAPVCIRCAKCLEVCPMHLQPLYLYRFEAAGDLTALKKLNLTDCIECGCCSYVCPGLLPLVERFRAGKAALREASA
jgi:electron transport complex protein RnfC